MSFKSGKTKTSGLQGPRTRSLRMQRNRLPASIRCSASTSCVGSCPSPMTILDPEADGSFFVSGMKSKRVRNLCPYVFEPDGDDPDGPYTFFWGSEREDDEDGYSAMSWGPYWAWYMTSIMGLVLLGTPFFFIGIRRKPFNRRQPQGYGYGPPRQYYYDDDYYGRGRSPHPQDDYYGQRHPPYREDYYERGPPRSRDDHFVRGRQEYLPPRDRRDQRPPPSRARGYDDGSDDPNLEYWR